MISYLERLLMGLKVKISKQFAIKLAVFMLLIVGAVVVDNYLDRIPKPVVQSESEPESSDESQNVVYMMYPSVNYIAKPYVQKTIQRKIFEVSQCKFLQKYHQIRAFHILKNEANRLNPNRIFVCYHFVFRHIYFSFHDDQSHIS